MFWNKPPDDDSAGKKGTVVKPAQASTPTPKTASSSAALNPPQPPATSQAEQALDRFEQELVKRFGKIRSALGPGTVIQGKLSFDAPVRIDGKLSGEIFSSQPLIIGPAAQVEATIEAHTLIVLGLFRGIIRAQTRVEVLQKGRIEGEIYSPVVVIEEGCSFSGSCSMQKAIDQSKKAQQKTQQPGQ